MVAGFVDVVSFLGEVKTPVLVEVTVGDDGAQLEDRLGAGESPAGAGDVEAVFDEVPAGAFDRLSYCLSVHPGCVKQGVFGRWDQYS